MKLITYILVAVAGGVLTSAVTYRVMDSRSRGTVPVSPPVVTRASRVVSRPVSAAGSAVELTKLSRENAELGAQLADATARLAQTDKALIKTREDLEELRRPLSADLSSSTLRAQLKSGEVVVTGGYKLPDGTRLYAFVQPTIEDANGAKVVRIASKVMMLPEEIGARVGLDNLATNAANTLQHGEVWTAEEQQSVMSAIGSTPDLRGINITGAAVPMGETSFIDAGDLRLKVTPAPGADAETMDFEVRLEQTPSAPAAEEVMPPGPVEESKEPGVGGE